MGTTEVQSGLRTVLLYAMPALSFMFISFQPGAVQLYFITSAIFAYAQARLITNTSFRNLIGMHPLIPKSKDPIPDALLPFGTGIPTPNPTGTPTTTPRIPSTTTTTTLLGPGGLKLYQPPRATSTSQAAKPNDTKPPPNVSMIDKFVDNAKAQKKEAVDGLYKMVGTTKEKRIAEAKAGRVKRAAEDYEKMMADEDERKRSQKQRRR
jgi:YidC/Oxa1 family membrane protein insertase